MSHMNDWQFKIIFSFSKVNLMVCSVCMPERRIWVRMRALITSAFATQLTIYSHSIHIWHGIDIQINHHLVFDEGTIATIAWILFFVRVLYRWQWAEWNNNVRSCKGTYISSTSSLRWFQSKRVQLVDAMSNTTIQEYDTHHAFHQYRQHQSSTWLLWWYRSWYVLLE